MSLYYADLTGVPIMSLALTVPMAGIWHADVVCDVTVDIAGPQVLTLSNSAWVCTPIRATDFAGRREVRLVGGQAGWRKPVPFKQYQSPGGVPTAMVLGDTAAFVQEPPPVVDSTQAPTVGVAYVRQAGLASLVLQGLLGDAWYMSPQGIVQTAPRLPTPIVSPFTVMDVRGASGRYTIATEFPGDWAPGSVFVSPTASGTVNLVRHVLREESLRTEVMVSP
jgi:hypothetical protein